LYCFTGPVKGVTPNNEPVRRFCAHVLFPGGRRCDIAVRSMEPALFALTATLDGDLASHCFVAACVWPEPGGEAREDVAEPRARSVSRSFFRLVASGAAAAGPESVATEDFYLVGLDLPRGLSELFAAYAAKGLGPTPYPTG